MKRAGPAFESNVRGGNRQRIGRQVDAEQAAKKESSLVSYLLLQWSWGLMSTPQVQCVAKKLLDDVVIAEGGLLNKTEIEKVANIGSQG